MGFAPNMARILLVSMALFAATGRAASPVDEEVSAGQELLRHGKAAEAIDHFRRAVKLSSGPCVACQVGLAKAYNAAGESRRALEAADEVLAATDDAHLQALAWNEKGLAWMADPGAKGKRLPDAEAAFRKASEIAADESILFNLAVSMLRQGKDAQGSELLRQYLARYGEAPRADSARSLLDNPERARRKMMPLLDLETLEGVHLVTRDFAGKVVLFDFWGTWCEPCRMAVPSLVRLNERMAGRPFQLVGIARESDDAPLRRFIDDHAMRWTQVWDRDQELLQRFGVQSFPTYVLFDAEGEIVYTASGWSDQIERQLALEVGRQVKRAQKSARGTN